MSADDHRLGLELVVVDARTFEVHHGGARVFTVVMPAGAPEFGTLRLTPHDRCAGQALISSLAQALEVDAPSTGPQVALSSVYVDFTSLGREGGLVLTKWFLRVDGQESEVYFNFDLGQGTAEFLEKDAEYAEPLLRSLARMLRDGEPSLASDPRFSSGPRFENERPVKLHGRLVLNQLFENEAVFTLGGRLLSLDLTAGSTRELAHFEGGLSARWSEAARCWQLTVASEEGDAFWLLEEEELTLIEPPPGCRAGASISPDRRWLAFARWHDATSRRGRYSEIVLVDRQRGATFNALDGERSFHVVEWSPRGVVLSVFEGIERLATKWVLLDFETGALTSTEPTAPRNEVTLEGGKLVLRSGVRVALTPAELEVVKPEHFSVASPRFLAWNRFDALVFVDVETGRLSAPLAQGDRRSVRLVPGFRHVVLRDEARWLVADVVL